MEGAHSPSQSSRLEALSKKQSAAETGAEKRSSKESSVGNQTLTTRDVIGRWGSVIVNVNDDGLIDSSLFSPITAPSLADFTLFFPLATFLPFTLLRTRLQWASNTSASATPGLISLLHTTRKDRERLRRGRERLRRGMLRLTPVSPVSYPFFQSRFSDSPFFPSPTSPLLALSNSY